MISAYSACTCHGNAAPRSSASFTATSQPQFFLELPSTSSQSLPYLGTKEPDFDVSRDYVGIEREKRKNSSPPSGVFSYWQCPKYQNKSRKAKKKRTSHFTRQVLNTVPTEESARQKNVTQKAKGTMQSLDPVALRKHLNIYPDFFCSMARINQDCADSLALHMPNISPLVSVTVKRIPPPPPSQKEPGFFMHRDGMGPPVRFRHDESPTSSPRILTYLSQVISGIYARNSLHSNGRDADKRGTGARESKAAYQVHIGL